MIEGVSKASQSLFPTDLPERQWSTFSAEGYSNPVTGVIYRNGDMLPGMPLGGLGTGFISLGTDGTIDYYCTIFNNFLERQYISVIASKEPHNMLRKHVPSDRQPFLGIFVEGKTNLLSLASIKGVESVQQIEYWGHYPVADVQYHTNGPIDVSMRAWTPFIPGHADVCNIPGSMFEVKLHNTSQKNQEGTLAFSFNGPRKQDIDHGLIKYASETMPKKTKSAIGGHDTIQFNFKSQGVQMGLANQSTSSLSGDPSFTLFFLGSIRRGPSDWVHPLCWGTGVMGGGKGIAIEIDLYNNRVDLSTGSSADISTENGCFKDSYDKPTIICIRKASGELKKTTFIYINGVEQLLTGPDIVPDIQETPIYVGGNSDAGFITPDMDVFEVLVYDNALGDKELNVIGSYLGNKYGLTTNYDKRISQEPEKIPQPLFRFAADSYASVLPDSHVAATDIPNDLLAECKRETLQGDFTGSLVYAESKKQGYVYEYALGVLGQEKIRTGAALGNKADAWNLIQQELPAPNADDLGCSVAVDFSLKPGESKTVPFYLTWFAPNFNASKPYIHRYGTKFKSALEVVQFLHKEHGNLFRRIIAWQEAIYTEDRIPGWLQDSLINVLAVLPQQSLWIRSPDPHHWWGNDAFFAVCESQISCAQMSCIANDQFGEWPANILFPELALRKLSAFKHYQNKETGQTPSTLGQGVEPDTPWFNQQIVIDGQVYIHMVERYRLASGDDKILDEWYPSVKAGMQFMFTVDEDGNGLLDSKGTNQYYDGWGMDNNAIHVSTYWLSTLRIVERMAHLQGDVDFARECSSWYERGLDQMETLLWNGSTQSYLLYHNTVSGHKSDTVLSDQLFGEWFVRIYGLPDIVSPLRLKTVMSTLERLNVAATEHGIRTAARPDGSEDRTGFYAPLMTPSYSTLTPSSLMIMTGDPHFKALGLDIVRRTWNNIVNRQNMAWDQPCMVRIDGVREWGLEYYHNTMLWAFPMAVLDQDLRTACSSGGFYNKIIQAGR